MRHLHVDTLALDFLEHEDGQFVVLESNETGFGFHPRKAYTGPDPILGVVLAPTSIAAMPSPRPG